MQRLRQIRFPIGACAYRRSPSRSRFDLRLPPLPRRAIYNIKERQLGPAPINPARGDKRRPHKLHPPVMPACWRPPHASVPPNKASPVACVPTSKAQSDQGALPRGTASGSEFHGHANFICWRRLYAAVPPRAMSFIHSAHVSKASDRCQTLPCDAGSSSVRNEV